MEFDSPDAAKEFPGLYLAESGKVDDSLEYTDEGDKKKSKKEKKKDKDKGYSALAAESSQDEEDPLDPKSPGKGMKIKAFSKLSGKKKDKDKKSDKAADKEQKKAEKEAKEKRKSEEKERKSMEKELSSTPGPAVVARPQIPFSGAHHMKANTSSHSASLTPQSSFDRSTPVKKLTLSSSSVSAEASSKDSTPVSKPPKEKSAAFNVFLNAPAPLLSKLKDKDKDKDKHKEHKDKKIHKEKSKEKGESKSKKEHKEHKEHKEKDKKDHSHASGMAKVKLKLMRSKNSLEEPNDPPHITSHQFPEDPEQLAKEIKKYEGLLEQVHLHLKSSKKISKKQEENLWELQITLTQLKRKLRSINALSSASSYHVHAHPTQVVEHSISPPHHPIFKKCDSIDGHSRAKMNTTNAPSTSVAATAAEQQKVTTATAAIPIDRSTAKENTSVTAVNVPMSSSAPQEIPKIPLPPSKSSYKADATVATSLPKLVSPPPPQVAKVTTVLTETEQKSPSSAETSKSCRNSVILSSPTLVSSGTTSATVPIPDSSCSVSSPRSSIDTVVQVHRLSGSADKSDAEEIPVDSEREQEDVDEYFDNRSISNLSMESSQADSKESIEAVLDDANKMIGSMHEELMFETTMELVNGDERLRSVDHLKDSSARILGQDDSDVELFTNDLELELPNEEPCPDPFSMPVFDTTEYLCIENEALSMFNELLADDLKKEQNDLEILLEKLPTKTVQKDTESYAENENDYNDLIKVWTQQKSENDILWDNVNRLRQAVAACKVDEFRLQTRLKYMESKASVLSPVTTTTPLQAEG